MKGVFMTINKPGIVIMLLAQLMAVAATGFGDVPPVQKPEVEHLISYLANTNCVMIRNGKKHDGEEAAKHVRRKYDHFRDDIGSTEEFIQYSATKSLLSSKLYQVQCPGEPAVNSRDWLLAELDSYRQGQ